ncbi:N-acetyltransferase [Coxiella burnetii]|uniref:Acetyltransferase, GNAT family n=1 Tax=Coxiella burnetii (strain Dugway 5J108-111) TaxID=434922 RepID=A9KCJ4_COXBN|nr:GNAT family protein [Coxiella burnetii]ABS77838.1 acetyltransferase, GNAT family [Coxiella burnetii Dugway 5J108-111]OYK80265.1 N-acetyltransferase [Coxiella burnetii]OYK82347.1 N-acetyltransferase [Coxiella burnetii]
MEAEKRWPFSVEYDGKVVGSTSYYSIDPKNRQVNIGYTWYHPRMWGTKLNSTVKFILLEYAFEQLKFIRIAFCVDQLNYRSCRALEKLGAKREGVLRKHMIRSDGTFRNSVIYGITDDDWSTIKNNLQKII